MKPEMVLDIEVVGISAMYHGRMPLKNRGLPDHMLKIETIHVLAKR